MSKFIPPDWRDYSAYPTKFDDWSFHSWAWEFLRRNPEYQKDYEHFDKLPSYDAYGRKNSKWYDGKGCEWWHSVELRYCRHPILPDEDTVLEYVTRTGDRTPYEYSLEEYLMEKWGIVCEQIYDPADDEGWQSFFEIDPRLPKVIDYSYDPDKEEFVLEKNRGPENSSQEVLLFDLRYPIDKQLDHAKEYLMYCREALENGILQLEKVGGKGFRIESLPEYLRAYDANQAGATNLEVAKYVYPERKVDSDHAKYDRNDTRESDKQKGYRTVKTGKNLVNGGYKDLLKLF